MTREEAIRRIKAWNLDPDDMEVLSVVIPELAESEDERIIRAIIDALYSHTNSINLLSSRGYQMEDIEAWLEKQKERVPENAEMGTQEQKPALIAENDNWYICIKDFYAGGKKWASVGDLVQAKNGMYMMGRDDISEWFRRAYYEEVRDAFGPNTDTNIPEKPAEWSEEDEDTINLMIAILRENHPNSQFKTNPVNTTCMSVISTDMLIKRIESLRPSWKPSEHQMTILKAVKDYVGKGSGYWGEGLGSLIDDLEKLM